MKFLDKNSAGDIYAIGCDDALNIHLGVMGFYSELNKMFLVQSGLELPYWLFRHI